MSRKNFELRMPLFLLLAVTMSVVPTFAGSAVIGSVAGSTNATVGGQVLTPNTTLFSGDSLRVSDGVAVVAMGMGSRMVFGRDTVASFERAPEEVTALLGQGNVSMYHPENGMPLRVKVGEVTVVAGKGYMTLGEVAMVNGVVVVTAKEGMLKVEGPERSTELTKGKTIAIMHQPAGSPQPQAGSASSHMTQGEVINIVTLGGVAANVVMSIVNLKRTNDVKSLVNTTNTNALAAKASADAATTAANNATVAATAAKNAANQAGVLAAKACHSLSPIDPNCTFTPQ